LETVLISGGTGLVGKHLGNTLKNKGYKVVVFGRTNQVNLERTPVDYIIHLAAANIGDKRWTAKRKQLIIDSRVKTAELIYEQIKQSPTKPKAFISASAIGYYGCITSNKIFCETDSSYNDFLGNTCRLWEQSAERFENLGIRTVKLRTGVVLTQQGGALAKMIKPIRLGIGSAIGSGKQYLPWIHIDDLCGIYIKAIEDTQMRGAYNAVAPHHITNKEFTKTLAHALRKPFWFPNVPAMFMKILFGEMSDILVKGSRVSSEKIKAAGYNFTFSDLSSALKDLL